MPNLTLRHGETELIYLGCVYHLGRPGSETDPETLRPHGLGLGPVREALEPQLGQATATIEIEVSAYQLSRLGQALHGVANELKQFEMAQRRSAVPGFAEALTRLYPDVMGTDAAIGPDATGSDDDEPGTALDLVPQVIMLRRRLDAAIRQADADLEAARTADEQPRGRHWWQLWRR